MSSISAHFFSRTVVVCGWVGGWVVCVCVCVCVYVCVCVCVCVRDTYIYGPYMYINTYINTYIHTYTYTVRGDYDEAEDLLKRVISLQPSDATALCNYALLLQHVRRDAAAADKVYQDALALSPDGLSDEESVSLLYSYGTLCEGQLRQVRKAQALYERALALVPTDATVLNKLGTLHQLRFNDTKAAHDFFERALHLEPDNVDALSNSALLMQVSLVSA